MCLAVATTLSAMRQVKHLRMRLVLSSYLLLSGPQVVCGNLHPNYTLPSSESRRTLLRTSKGSTPNNLPTSTMRFRFVEGSYYTEETVLTH